MPTTPNGTLYTVGTLSDPVAGTVVYGYPDGHAPDMVTLLYAHGAGGAANQFAALAAWTGLRNALIDAGAGWIESTGGGDRSWGNDAARAAYVRAHEMVAAIIDLGQIIVLGRSMGGLVAQWLYTQSNIPNMVGLIINSGVQDIVAYYDDNTDTGRGQMRAAWGATDSATFYAAVAGKNPVEWDPSLWAGKHVHQLVGSLDTTVPPTRHAYPMRARYAGQPETDVLTVRQGGDHGQTNGAYLEVDAMMQFIGSVADLTPPAPKPRERLRIIAQYEIRNGRRYLLTPR